MRLLVLVTSCLLSTLAVAHKIDVKLPGWAVEFITQGGAYSRIGGYQSRAECEAAVHEIEKQQTAYDGHCVELKMDPVKGLVIMGSQDPHLDPTLRP